MTIKKGENYFMRKKINVAQGEKYGKLTVIKETNPRISPKGVKERRVLCFCECDGKEVEVGLSNLITGKTTSCGCTRKSKIKSGEVYGRLTVIKEVEEHICPGGGKIRMVLCQCSCGSDPVKVSLNSLKRGTTQSCGCYKREKDKENLDNKKYNTYDLTSKEYGIGYTLKGEPFWFDKEDYDLIKDYCWHLDNRGYVLARFGENKNIRFHRLVLHVKEDEVVDHINRIKHDNRKSNLRKCTQAENTRNITIQKNNTSGITGVYFDNGYKKWASEIKVNYKKIFLGYFTTKEEAAKVRYAAELKYFGEYSPNYEKLTQQQFSQSQQNT